MYSEITTMNEILESLNELVPSSDYIATQISNNAEIYHEIYSVSELPGVYEMNVMIERQSIGKRVRVFLAWGDQLSGIYSEHKNEMAYFTSMLYIYSVIAKQGVKQSYLLRAEQKIVDQINSLGNGNYIHVPTTSGRYVERQDTAVGMLTTTFEIRKLVT